jgi:hypothetical protein
MTIEIRVLLVAPHMSELVGVADEVYAVERTPGLAVTRLPPTLRRRELLQALCTQVFAVLWLATHGASDGVWLGEDDLLAGGDLVSMVRGAGLCGVMLNTCESAALAEMMHDATGVDVVYSVQATPDLSAFQMGVLFARHLGETGDFRAAFDRSRPGDAASFRYIPEYREALVVAPERYVFSTDELRTIYEAINEVRQRLSVVEVELRYVRQDLDSRRGELRAPAQWVIVLVGLLMSLGLFVLLYVVGGRL